MAQRTSGAKIALALKLLAIRYSRECGAMYLQTNNDSQNAPMLAINEKLGANRQYIAMFLPSDHRISFAPLQPSDHGWRLSSANRQIIA